jgi:glutathione synthase/RimK-type ligase-like ATP-grasp enzyme
VKPEVLKVANSRAVVLPYKMGSQSAKKLSQALTTLLGLRVRRVRHDRGRYLPRLRSLIVNYGSGSVPARWPSRGTWLNHPSNTTAAGNKLAAFKRFKDAGLSVPEFTTDRAVADGWVRDGATVVCRTLLNAHSGRGIVLSDLEHPLVHAPLYVKYKKKRKEFRVHVFKGTVIDVAEKRKRRVEVRPPHFDGYIRNLANGWVFCRDAIVRPADMDQLAVSACTALGLDFGAVDIIWNERENKSYVLEVNTAPGLEGTTLSNYAGAIARWIKAQ